MGGCSSHPRECYLTHLSHAELQLILQFLRTPERLELARTNKLLLREAVVLFLWQRPPDPLLTRADVLPPRRALNMLELMDNRLRRAEAEPLSAELDDDPDHER
jgi:hypothetical protein